eukprot:853064-Prorocentrum_minimum.AAC.1
MLLFDEEEEEEAVTSADVAWTDGGYFTETQTEDTHEEEEDALNVLAYNAVVAQRRGRPNQPYGRAFQDRSRCESTYLEGDFPSLEGESTSSSRVTSPPSRVNPPPSR